MKSSLIALLVLIFAPIASHGASLEDSYIAARDGYIKKFSQADRSGAAGDRLAKQETAALRQLEKQLQRIVGPMQLKGVPSTGKINLETLSKDESGFGTLDGLAYASKGDKTRIVVTTETLFMRWLAAHKNWWDNQDNVPQDIAGALASGAFYSQAISTGAAMSNYGELPITKPANTKVAFAVLAAWAQDIGPRTPGEIIVSVMQGGLVFVISAETKTKVADIPACNEIWDKSVKEAEKLFEVYSQSEPKDEKLFDQYTKTQNEGDEGFRRCFAGRVKIQHYFADLTRQAQALADQLPVK